VMFESVYQHLLIAVAGCQSRTRRSMMNFPKPSNIAYEADILEKVTKALLEVNQAKVARVGG